MIVDCYAAMAAKKPLEKFQYEAREVGDLDVQVKITHCGICYSDVHMIDNDAHFSTYPFVPGHEIVGQVSKTGARVTALQVGDRVGIGWQAGACMNCEWCVKGEENLCVELMNHATWSPYGGFATSIIVDSRFAFPIPENLASENAGPLLCGGITVYSPLRNHGIRPAMKVGIIGCGGLGHLAIQFASAFGCDVTAFSSSPDKEKEARAFGANAFVSSRDTGALQRLTHRFDFILSTIHGDLDWNAYLAMVKPNGKLCFVGLPAGAITLNPFSLIFGQASVCGSVIGGRPAIREMLEFAARHGITAQTEVMPMSAVNQAIARLKENKVHYRIVLKN
jgi:alcohol/geraniol dehydrogenase (NADP+)